MEKQQTSNEYGISQELLVLSELVNYGTVSIPYGNSARYDCILDIENDIYKIQIKGQKTMDSLENLSIFEKHEFNKLKVLLLNGIGLKNINAFSQCSFPELKLLDLEVNELGDDCIEIFNKLNLPKNILVKTHEDFNISNISES